MPALNPLPAPSAAWVGSDLEACPSWVPQMAPRGPHVDAPPLRGQPIAHVEGELEASQIRVEQRLLLEKGTC